MASLREENRRRERKFHIVTERWMYDCIEDGKQVGERSYDPEDQTSYDPEDQTSCDPASHGPVEL